jgi:hypothetical protein
MQNGDENMVKIGSDKSIIFLKKTSPKRKYTSKIELKKIWTQVRIKLAE